MTKTNRGLKGGGGKVNFPNCAGSNGRWKLISHLEMGKEMKYLPLTGSDKHLSTFFAFPFGELQEFLNGRGFGNVFISVDGRDYKGSDVKGSLIYTVESL